MEREEASEGTCCDACDDSSLSVPATPQRSAERRFAVCKQLIRSRLQQPEMMEENTQSLLNYSLMLLNPQYDLADMLASEKQDTIMLGASIRGGDPDYVCSFSYALEECWNVLMKRQ